MSFLNHLLQQPVPTKITTNGISPASPALRTALGCANPLLGTYLGNRLTNSISASPGINAPAFQIATGPGPLAPLQTTKYASYLLSYHHSGAPRTLLITQPHAHADVENAIYDTQDSSGNLFLTRPEHPSTCSQFVTHETVYVPSRTFSALRIPYTEVVQQQGEMVIIFPWAYHEAYTSGPNITEEILYAGDRCKVFHEEKLYRHCDSECAAGEPDNNIDLGAVFFDTLSGSRSGGR